MPAEPPPGVIIEALRQVRATLAGEPVPAVPPGYAQDVIWALAALAADAVTTTAAVTQGIPEAKAKSAALAYLDMQTSRLVLGEGQLNPASPCPPQKRPCDGTRCAGGCSERHSVGHQFAAI